MILRGSQGKTLIFARICSAAIVVIGVFGVAGWLSQSTEFRSLATSRLVMAPNTAVMLSLLGTALFLSGVRGERSRRAALALASLTVPIPLLRLAEVGGLIRWRVDELFVRVQAAMQSDVPLGTMAVPTAVGLLIGAGAVLALALDRSLPGVVAVGRDAMARTLGGLAGMINVGIGLVFLLGYAYGNPLAIHGSRIPVSLNTSVALVMAGVAVAAIAAARSAEERRQIIAELQDAKADLERRVTERTAELRAALGNLSKEAAAREAVQAELYHAQRIESVGRLAGGIAHDVNNLLTVLNGYISLAIDTRPPAALLPFLDGMRTAVSRAAELTRRLLAFARQQSVSRLPVDVNLVVASVGKLVRPLMGKGVEFEIKACPSPWRVEADALQLEQVIMNLAVNARDAMPHGGRLLVATCNETIETPIITEYTTVPPGRYASISVADTGQGIAPEILSKIFEPFFTTKSHGMGTGLGLATSNGIVHQHGGRILVSSREGAGSTFTVYLPVAAGSSDSATVTATDRPRSDAIARPRSSPMTPEPAPRPQPAPNDPVSGPRRPIVLVIDDDQDVRTIVRGLLASEPLQVHVAGSGEQAIQLAAGLAEPVDLVLADVVMPGLSRQPLVDALRARWPAVRIVFMSGYYDEQSLEFLRGVPLENRLNKPFSKRELVQRVHEALAR